MGKKKKMKSMRRERELELRERKGKKNWLVIAIPVMVAVIAVSIFFAMSGGGEQGGGLQNNSPIDTNGTGGIVRPTWIDAQVEGNAVSIPAGEVDAGKMLHFGVTAGQGDKMNFMAYQLDGERYVRANVCPPCRSIGFSLAGDILVCNSCGTKFEASTAEGISGACKDYPKAEVAHVISGDRITMATDDLVNAYLDTEKPGWP